MFSGTVEDRFTLHDGSIVVTVIDFSGTPVVGSELAGYGSWIEKTEFAPAAACRIVKIDRWNLMLSGSGAESITRGSAIQAD